jgi:tRNA-specific 2-thiouridylase
VNWLAPVPADAVRCAVKLRAREEPRPAVVRTEAGWTNVVLDEPALPAPGQACVFYAGDRILGGGIIARPGEPPA